MIFIFPNSAYDASADGSATNYPAANVLDDDPAKSWRGNATSNTLTVYAEELVEAVMLVNVRASAGGTITITNTFTSEILKTESISLDYVRDYSQLVAGERNEWKNWVTEWDCVNEIVRIDIELTDGSFPEVGVVMAGPKLDIGTVQQGLTVKPSAKKFVSAEKNNFGSYCEPRRVADDWNATLKLYGAADFWRLKGFCDAMTALPLGIVMVDAAASERQRFAVYGYIADHSGNNNQPGLNDFIITIREKV